MWLRGLAWFARGRGPAAPDDGHGLVYVPQPSALSLTTTDPEDAEGGTPRPRLRRPPADSAHAALRRTARCKTTLAASLGFHESRQRQTDGPRARREQEQTADEGRATREREEHGTNGRAAAVAGRRLAAGSGEREETAPGAWLSECAPTGVSVFRLRAA